MLTAVRPLSTLFHHLVAIAAVSSLNKLSIVDLSLFLMFNYILYLHTLIFESYHISS
jgi:hypothetical protein